MSCGHTIVIKKYYTEGGGGGGGTIEINEVSEAAVGTTDGVNTNFYSTYPIIEGTLIVTCNGVTQKQNIDYWQTGTNSILLAWAPTQKEEIFLRYNTN